MNPHKIAYFMHIHWNWIKQRPHFLYEKLMESHQMDLFFVNRLFDGSLKGRKDKLTFSKEPKKTVELIKLPYSFRFPGIRFIEREINQFKLKKNEYDLIWITSPIILHFLPDKYLLNKKVIYDCMDDFLCFKEAQNNLLYNEQLERRLIETSTVVITSSQRLKDVILRRYPHYPSESIHCINNALSDKLVNYFEMSMTEKGDSEIDNLGIVYFGTISEWFDFELVLKLLEFFPQLKFTLIGPVEVKIPEHPRLIVYGTVAHEELELISQKALAFIMPFIVNELILAVNPVKIYEYIAFNKPIISVRYPETIEFDAFVHLYSDVDEAIEITKKILEGTSKEPRIEEKLNFLSQNTWDCRVETVNQIIEGVMGIREKK